MTNEDLIEQYPVYTTYYDGIRTLYYAVTNPFPNPETVGHGIFCEAGITFSKGGMPFQATLKQDSETREGYLDIVPCGKDAPHITMTGEDIKTLDDFQNKLEKIVDGAFRDGRLDAQEIEPHPYLTEIDDFEDFLEVVDCDIHRSEEGEKHPERNPRDCA